MTSLTTNVQKPDYLANLQISREDFGTELMSQYIIPPRLKVVQPLSRGEYKEKFTPGDAVLAPQMLKVIGLDVDDKHRPMNKSQQVLFTPLFFFAEFICWNPLQATTLQAVRERSFDPNSIIAKKARDQNARQSEPCPEYPDKPLSYQEHLNFVCLLHLEGLNTLPVVIPFSRAEFKIGRNFMSLIKTRVAPMYACKFAFNVVFRENEKGQWYGLNIENPPENVGGFVDEAMFKMCKEQYDELKKAHSENRIVVDLDDNDAQTLDGQVVSSEM